MLAGRRAAVVGRWCGVAPSAPASLRLIGARDGTHDNRHQQTRAHAVSAAGRGPA